MISRTKLKKENIKYDIERYLSLIWALREDMKQSETKIAKYQSRIKILRKQLQEAWKMDYEKEQQFLGMIDALQTVIKVMGEQVSDLQHNLTITTMEVQNLKRKVTILEPYVFENAAVDEEY